ncbi:MAG: hypothetical protein ACKOCQ_00160, partial [Candidatus Nitrosotenuis sp.]
DADLQLVYSKNTKFENIQRSDKTKTDSCFEKDTMNKAFCKIILKLYKIGPPYETTFEHRDKYKLHQ